MLTEVDYWDEEVIPEDWHVYLKCCFTLGDRVHVESLYLPLGNDCVLTDSYWKTLQGALLQSVRHAWGASDIPYAWRAAVTGPARSSLKRRLLWPPRSRRCTSSGPRSGTSSRSECFLPSKFAVRFDAPLPYWWTHRTAVPGPGWHPENILHPSTWLAFDKTGIVEPTMWVNICGILIAVCIVPLLVLIAVELKVRGPKPVLRQP